MSKLFIKTKKINIVCVSLTVLAGDDAKIRVWRVPEGGLTETLTEPALILQGGKNHWNHLDPSVFIIDY